MHHIEEMVRVAIAAINKVQVGDGLDVLVFRVIDLKAIHIRLQSATWWSV